MKKAFYSLMALAAISFASCGGNTKSEVVTEDSTGVENVASEEEVVTAVDKIATALESGDAATVQTNVQNLSTKIQQLIESGDVETAKAYALKLQEWYNQNKEKVEGLAQNGTTIEQLINAAVALPVNAEGAAQGLIDAAKEDVGTIKEAAKEVAEQKTNEAKEAVKAKAEEEINKAADATKAKAEEKVNEAAKKAANKLLGK